MNELNCNELNINEMKRDLKGLTMGDVLEDKSFDSEHIIFYVTYDELMEFCRENKIGSCDGEYLTIRNRALMLSKMLHEKLIIVPITNEHGKKLTSERYVSAHYRYISGEMEVEKGEWK